MTDSYFHDGSQAISDCIRLLHLHICYDKIPLTFYFFLRFQNHTYKYLLPFGIRGCCNFYLRQPLLLLYTQGT